VGEYLNVELNQIIKVLELKSLACNDKRKENELFEFYWRRPEFWIVYWFDFNWIKNIANK